jgi:hypothetical protein
MVWFFRHALGLTCRELFFTQLMGSFLCGAKAHFLTYWSYGGIMAKKKKINVRKDYSYEAKKRLPSYKPAKVQRKVQFLILRGPGLDQDETQDANVEIKRAALLLHKKVKFVQVKSISDAVAAIKDANTWAGGVVYLPADIQDETGVGNAAIKKVIIKTVTVKSNDECVDALKKLIDTQED